MSGWELAALIVLGWFFFACLVVIPAARFCASNVYDEEPSAESAIP
jgi:hypothetical protein